MIRITIIIEKEELNVYGTVLRISIEICENHTKLMLKNIERKIQPLRE
jgi:hypothetical protein